MFWSRKYIVIRFWIPVKPNCVGIPNTLTLKGLLLPPPQTHNLDPTLGSWSPSLLAQCQDTSLVNNINKSAICLPC